jgi:hypothetical protein
MVPKRITVFIDSLLGGVRGEFEDFLTSRTLDVQASTPGKEQWVPDTLI